jgi:flagellar motor switch protein FliG
MRPAWKSAFSTPGDWRTATYAVGGGLVALLAALIAGVCLIGAGRALGRELAARPRGGDMPMSPPAPLPALDAGPAGFLDGETAEDGSPGAPTALLGRRFDFLEGRDMEIIAKVLAEEKPEDLALFFGHLAGSIPDMASRLFSHIPADVQAEASRHLLKLSLADPERLDVIEARLRSAVSNGVMGPQSLGRILSRVPGDARADLLGRLAVRDARAVQEVERNVFAFEDIEKIGPAQLRRLLGAVPYETWGPALRGAPSSFADQVLGDLPDGPRELVRSSLETPQTREKIAEARSLILDALSELTVKGDIKLESVDQGGGLV